MDLTPIMPFPFYPGYIPYLIIVLLLIIVSFRSIILLKFRMSLIVRSIVILWFYVPSRKDFNRTLLTQLGPKGLEPQSNRHMPHGKWQQENMCVSALAPGKGWKKQPPLGIWTIRQYPRRSEIWIHTTSVDIEFNGRWSQVSSASSEWCKPKSHLEELTSIQVDSNCKKALLVGCISMSEMSCNRKMCTLELMQYYLFPNWSLLVHRNAIFSELWPGTQILCYVILCYVVLSLQEFQCLQSYHLWIMKILLIFQPL